MKKILLVLLVMFLVTGCSFNKAKEENNDVNNENNVEENSGNIGNDDNVVNDDNLNNDNNSENFQEYVYTTLDMEIYNSLSTPININTTSDLDIKKENVDVNSQIIKELQQMIIVDSSLGSGIYKDTKVTVDNLNVNYILVKALEKVIACEYDENGNVIEKDYNQFTPEDLKAKVIELYGSDIVKDYKVHISESAYGGWSYDEITNTYLPEGGAGGCIYRSNLNLLEEIVKATKDEENIYLYTEYYFMFSAFGNSNIFANYNDYIEWNPIGGEQSDDFPYTRFEGLEEGQGYYNYFKEKYPNIIHTYKHTFTKGNNGNYYWVSTEPLTK